MKEQRESNRIRTIECMAQIRRCRPICARIRDAVKERYRRFIWISECSRNLFSLSDLGVMGSIRYAGYIVKDDPLIMEQDPALAAQEEVENWDSD